MMGLSFLRVPLFCWLYIYIYIFFFLGGGRKKWRAHIETIRLKCTRWPRAEKPCQVFGTRASFRGGAHKKPKGSHPTCGAPHVHRGPRSNRGAWQGNRPPGEVWLWSASLQSHAQPLTQRGRLSCWIPNTNHANKKNSWNPICLVLLDDLEVFRRFPFGCASKKCNQNGALVNGTKDKTCGPLAALF